VSTADISGLGRPDLTGSEGVGVVVVGDRDLGAVGRNRATFTAEDEAGTSVSGGHAQLTRHMRDRQAVIVAGRGD
jgi:hypothetical protein